MKEARPTEYKGIVFRSKTEAVFARSMDVQAKILWEYEPTLFSVNDWQPDFWLVWKDLQDRKLYSVIIELKPAPPTETYKAELSERFFVLKDRDVAHLLVVGNPFNQDDPRYVEIWKEGNWTKIPGNDTWIFNSWEKAVKYRFDLKAEV